MGKCAAEQCWVAMGRTDPKRLCGWRCTKPNRINSAVITWTGGRGGARKINDHVFWLGQVDPRNATESLRGSGLVPEMAVRGRLGPHSVLGMLTWRELWDHHVKLLSSQVRSGLQERNQTWRSLWELSLKSGLFAVQVDVQALAA